MGVRSVSVVPPDDAVELCSSDRAVGLPRTHPRHSTVRKIWDPKQAPDRPLSAAIAIGTGGPFGAEGPIIATGGALGSLVGQVLETTADERKTLLAAGAAAGMAATFGSPVAATLLAIELLLFEYRARSCRWRSQRRRRRRCASRRSDRPRPSWFPT